MNEMFVVSGQFKELWALYILASTETTQQNQPFFSNANSERLHNIIMHPFVFYASL